ncbi:hypothetical protein Tco_0707095 [Tanacetum coccineum]|uniref:Uncharacterized protein n=1 Tax=Tanacetum coccineum TaxID=301880 RepID=A0ABQ4Y984_9ASTR
MAVVSSCLWNPEQTAGDKPEEGEDDVKSSCPLCPGRHTCYNGRDKGSRSREGELTPKTHPQFGLQAATRLHEAGIASNRCYFTKTCHGKEEGEQAHLESAVQRRVDGPAAPGKRIEEASDSFTHAPLGSGGCSSVGRAPLLQLDRCDYGLDV